MLLKCNLFETLSIISCSGSLICILLNYVTNISPITGVWFVIYILFWFFLSVWFSFKFIRWFLLHLNKPLNYDRDKLVKGSPFLSGLAGILPKLPKKSEKERREYDTTELSVISSVLERKLVSSWYTHFVSQEIGFPFACKQLLDQMIGKAFQICNKIDTKEIYIDICSVFITHLKEYKKALKRHEKSPNEPIESLYKKSDQIFTSDVKNQSAEHCTNVLRVIMKELVPWELWDTPHSELLVRILAKKLDNFIDNTLADPVWLNDTLMTILEGKKAEDVPEEKVQETDIIQEEIQPVTIVQDVVEKDIEIEKPLIETVPKPETTIESALSTLVTKTTAPILQNALNDEYEGSKDIENIDMTATEAINGSEPIDISAAPIMRQRRGRQGRNEVKIYDRIIEGSVKTWETDMDLQYISLGQDLLASLNGEITLSRLWGQDNQDYDGKQESRFYFGEEDALEMESDSKEVSPVKKEHSPNPADALLKDLQTTVHQAKTKIGDLQVPLVIDVPNNDEAAGMMEGLLDFGIAGLKKGLRFTGLSDDAQEKSPSHKEKSEKSPPADAKLTVHQKPAELKDPKTVKPKPADLKDLKLVQPKETGISSLIQREDNGNTPAPPLVKQQRVTSQDSMLASAPKPIPFPLLADSPEPEYEEAADLSSSIAKLRCLLQQRAEAGNTGQESKPGEIWWEGAEEYRGKTQQHHSSRPVDTASFADEYDMNAAEKTSPTQSSNNMQRLDKLFQRTVTGVFNSIKTAVGGEDGEGAPPPARDWAYVCTPVELSVGGAVARLVGSRRAYNHVDAALDSLEQLGTTPPKKQVAPEDFEEWCSAAGAGWCASAELAVAGGLCESHLTYRVATLLFADLAEPFISFYLEEMTAWLRKQIFAAFENCNQESSGADKRALRKLDIEETCKALVDKLDYLALFGADRTREAVRLCLRSLQHGALNKLVLQRALALAATRARRAAHSRHSSVDHQ